ncbi:hypothetical protein L9F63_024825, partial [Diploptera punctata]
YSVTFENLFYNEFIFKMSVVCLKIKRPLDPKKVPNNEAVQVVVRCRPMNYKEQAAGHSRVIECYPGRGVIEIKNPNPKDTRESTKTFTFDAVYDWNSRQEHIYDETVRPLVASVLDGFNGTIFAYGQTGTGKTYTMEGAKNDVTQKGVIPRSFEQIFSHISRSSNVQYLVRTSYLEIYQEEIRDLLTKDQNKRYELRENSEKFEQVMYIGNQNRKIGATNMNEHSSRSHAIFLITIEMSCLNDMKVIRVGKLNLVDLAGSERQSKTGATGERLKEASKINLSLSALGNVISALVMSAGRSIHIPYRDSKLTRILQDSLGGNSKTIMIANVGPASYNYDESLTTLRYANRAKNIKNQPRVNEDPKDALLRQYKVEIARLKGLLNAKLKEREDFSTQQKIRLEQSTILKDKKCKEDENQVGEVDESNKKHRLSKYSDEERQRISAEIEHNRLLANCFVVAKNIIDHTNEQQRALEQRNAEIADKKKLEVEMRQRLELQEESCIEYRGTYSTLQQEAEAKTKKLKKLFTKLQIVKQDIHDITDEYNRDRRELELTQNDMLKELKLKYLIIENFISLEEKNRFLNRVWYDEDYDQWCLRPHTDVEDIASITARPVSADDERRPVSEYSRVAIQVGRHHRYHGENVLGLELDPIARTTADYQSPLIAPKIKAVLEEALKDDEIIDVDASALNISQIQCEIPIPAVTCAITCITIPSSREDLGPHANTLVSVEFIAASHLA